MKIKADDLEFDAIEAEIYAREQLERMLPVVDVVEADRQGRKITRADKAEAAAAEAASDASLDRWARTRPMTKDGVRAAIEHAILRLPCLDHETLAQFLTSIAESEPLAA